MNLGYLGIIVFGHRRPRALWNVLESLRRQGALPLTHVWIDGFAHSHEHAEKVGEVRKLKQQFPVAQWVDCNGRLGIEKLMLDGLTWMARQYRNIIVLEDDCFPTADAVETFVQELEAIAENPHLYSVYGHPFRVSGEDREFSRFQGWGWATTRKKLIPVLAQLKSMFMMTEPDYLAWVASNMTPQTLSTLNVTPGRDVQSVLAQQFSWDSATTLLTALLGMKHQRTARQIVYNCGLGEGSGHFHSEAERFRAPPFNMIGGDEVWQYFHTPPAPQYQGRTYFGLDELDRKLAPYLPTNPGFFVELGGHDGLNQSNTLYFERRGWQGILIEAVPEAYEQCRRNRPLSRVVHAACVGPEWTESEVELHSVGLMSLVKGARGGGQPEEEWIERGESLQNISRRTCRAPARTLTSILEEHAVKAIDLLSLDVEGFEKQVLQGLDFKRYPPRFILVEDSTNGDLAEYVIAKGYHAVATLSERNFTRDVLFEQN